DPGAALEVLERYAPTPEARAARAPTPRERGWMEAVDVLYAPGEKEARDTAYARAMERLVEAYPRDYEARAFHALALLGLSQGDRHVPTYMRAGAEALELLRLNPTHPGAAHYVIHSFDDPTHAPLGLRAARAYSGIAPEAAHAQHMTSHIFLALGMWEEVVEANERAAGVVNRSLDGRGLPPYSCGHYNEWLLYGYQQKGRHGAASRLLRACHEDSRDPALPEARRSGAARSFAFMRALHLADTRAVEGFPAAAPVDTASLPEASRTILDFGTGFAAVHRGDVAQARRSLAALADRGADDVGYVAAYAPVWEGTLRSLVLAREGQLEEAIAGARTAADYEAELPVDFGPPIAAKPPRELQGELLLEAGRAEEAMAAFGLALGRTPRRALTLAGYARAADASGRGAVAADAWRTLTEILASADPGLPVLAEARAFLEREGTR
ncbi:MAG TPA: hypothetical protein VLL48_01170, partial [Longimicrobiales bacterium]|nr:hypothetical protein [Longimicrobiales bacterium]